MAIKLIANYCKRLGLPGYSSHQFSVSVETELVTTDDIAGESERLYQRTPSPPWTSRSSTPDSSRPPTTAWIHRDPGNPPGERRPGTRLTNVANWQRGPAWKCSDKQKDLILKLVEEHQLDKADVEALASRTLRQGRAHPQQSRSLRAHRRIARHPRRRKPPGQRQAPQRLRLQRGQRKEGRMIADPSPIRAVRHRADTLGANACPTTSARRRPRPIWLLAQVLFRAGGLHPQEDPAGPAPRQGGACRAPGLSPRSLAGRRTIRRKPSPSPTKKRSLDLERDEGPVKFKDDAEREKVRLDGLRVVAAYLDSPEAMKEKPRAVEVMLKEEIPGLSVPLTGAMDLVEGNFTPVDFKSAAAKPDRPTRHSTTRSSSSAINS